MVSKKGEGGTQIEGQKGAKSGVKFGILEVAKKGFEKGRKRAKSGVKIDQNGVQIGLSDLAGDWLKKG